MENTEKNQVKSYLKKDDPLSGLNLRLRYMVEDFDELINAELNNRRLFTKPRLERQSFHLNNSSIA